jgi:photosystem II stability/assembly factor-like uncharacterized protein
MDVGRLRPRALLALLALLLAGCGSAPERSAREVALPPGVRAPRVLGLTAEPGGAFFVSTDRGLLRIAPGAARAERLVRAMTGSGPPVQLRDDSPAVAVGKGTLLGSGHPAGPGEPSNLGLLVSADDGRTWQPVALTGQADLHLLQARGARLWAYDLANRRLVHTTDNGATWSSRRPPGLLTDLAVDPADDRHLIVVSEHGPLASTDGGRTWRPLGVRDASRVAWPRPDALVFVDGSGTVSRSTDGGGTARTVGSLGARPAGPLAATPHALYAPVTGGRILRSDDDGATWQPVLRLAPAA